jgi:hypothetical protein
VLILGGVTLIGVGLANYQGTFHVSLDAALAAIGVGKSAYVWGRAVVLTVTGVAGAFLLHMPKQVLTAAQVQAEREQKRLRAELDAEDAALAAARRRRMVAGWKDTAAAFGPAAAVQVEAVPEVAPALAMEAAKEAPAAPTPLIPEPLAAAIRRGRAPHVSTSADALAATQA